MPLKGSAFGYRTWPLTPMVKRILVVNAAVWLVEVVTVLWVGTAAVVEHLALTPARVFPGLELWQPFTYMWLHEPDGLLHIVLNSLFLWMFGGDLETRWGSRAFLRFYLTCGVGAGLVVFLVGIATDPEVATFGASGAIDGLVVAWAITNWRRPFLFFGLVPMTGKHFAILMVAFVGVDILLRTPGTSHVAHLAGMAVGALLVTGYWRPGKINRALRHAWLRRRLEVLEGGRPKAPPQDGGYLH